MKKSIAIWIILLFLLSSLIPITSSNEVSSNNIITVDDEGDGDFSTILEAVNFSSPGDTIEVYSGTYDNHQVDIKKYGITLIGIPWELGEGNDTGKPLATYIKVRASNVTVSNFRFESKDVYAIIQIGSINNCKITNNTIYSDYKFYHGVFAYKSSRFTISNNEFEHLNSAIGVDRGDEFSITNNTFKECLNNCISIYDTSNNSPSIISHNIFENCRSPGISYTISKLLISNNHFRNCYTGIEQYGTNSVSEWRDSRIFSNEFRSCGAGVYMDGMKNVKDVPKISNNNFFYNSDDITFYQYSLIRYNRPDNRVVYNNYYDVTFNETTKIHKGKAVIMYIPIIIPWTKPPFFIFLILPITIPWLLIDRNPAQEPYDIPLGGA